MMCYDRRGIARREDNKVDAGCSVKDGWAMGIKVRGPDIIKALKALGIDSEACLISFALGPLSLVLKAT